MTCLTRRRRADRGHPPHRRRHALDPRALARRRQVGGQGATAAGHAAAQSEQSKVTEWRRLGEDASQYDFVPFGVETYGLLGASAQSFLKQLGDVAASRGTVSKAAFVRSAYREVSCALQRGLGM